MKIIVGYIKSPEGQAAITTAAAEARLRDAEVVVVHSMRGGGRDEAEQSVTYASELTGLEERLAADGIRVQTRELVRGQSPAEDLIEVAKQEDAALIVIGLRKRSQVGKLILGSNAQQILLNAPCPVLAVKAESKD
ncbi:MAG TPA: universal stress protein [Egibacteraceae bacterium]|nr:universal stress protein [Egibacteraceae bacterium]